ncbi:hypothetical protein BDK51DRAFT_41528 [Blyttiomyces helicus]|uniref:Uncharacterized protein n=1 Tax=Blyttiomyces helicus TaxID=388810 RepID=A0A4V1IS91_9FUNG|nr:hypothetical protein BDK51DRAFT_41528 [Blyttiomyces helicus]|eukprot:RKO92737.1 hypothetical protein BDK51DRAFT_41528 [Blyttiomyces helicus]
MIVGGPIQGARSPKELPVEVTVGVAPLWSDQPGVNLLTRTGHEGEGLFSLGLGLRIGYAIDQRGSGLGWVFGIEGFGLRYLDLGGLGGSFGIKGFGPGYRGAWLDSVCLRSDGIRSDRMGETGGWLSVWYRGASVFGINGLVGALSLGSDRIRSDQIRSAPDWIGSDLNGVISVPLLSPASPHAHPTVPPASCTPQPYRPPHLRVQPWNLHQPSRAPRVELLRAGHYGEGLFRERSARGDLFGGSANTGVLLHCEKPSLTGDVADRGCGGKMCLEAKTGRRQGATVPHLLSVYLAISSTNQYLRVRSLAGGGGVGGD